MTVPHTPTPWKQRENNPRNVAATIRDDRGDAATHVVAVFASAGDAAFAVHAANCHDAAPDMKAAIAFAQAAKAALDSYERDLGKELSDDHEIGRIPESRDTPSFRIRAGHIRMMAAALAKAEGRT